MLQTPAVVCCKLKAQACSCWAGSWPSSSAPAPPSLACAALQFSFPGVLGMLLSGMAASNINNGHLVRGLPASWSKEIRAIALSIIFLRSGLELDLRVSLGLPEDYIQP